MNGLGTFEVTTIWPVPLLAVTVAPAGTPTPISGERFAGLAMKSMLRLTTDAVIA